MNVPGTEVTLGILSICSAGVGWVGVGVGFGVGAGGISGCHATCADIMVGRRNKSEADNLILAAVMVYEGGFASQPSILRASTAPPLERVGLGVGWNTAMSPQRCRMLHNSSG